MIPFNRPGFIGEEECYLKAAIEGGHYSGDGSFTLRCQDLLQQLLGAPKVLLTTSCTHALELSALLLDIAPGDEVILPAFTFVSTANAFVLRGAKPVFADVRPDTLNLDERALPDLVTDRTRAIAVVHYAGVGCEMDAITALANASGAAVVEDNAHGLFGSYRGRPLGTFGALATQSFHETKNVSCGEGGALVINDTRLIGRAEILREKGTNRSRFFRGEVDKYTWVDVGSSYLPSDLLAAVLLGQLEQHAKIQSHRRHVWEVYDRELAGWAAHQGVVRPQVPAHCEQAYHMYYLLLPTAAARARFIGHLRERGIVSVFHYVPLNTSEMGQRFGGRVGQCPVTEDISDRLARLPFFNGLAEEDQMRVVEAILDFEAA